MASIMHHLAIGQLYYEKYLIDYSENDKQSFLMGVIAPDCGKQLDDESNRMKSHFIEHTVKNDNLDLDIYIPDVELFVDKYKDKLKDPFVLGCLIHLITDKFWFEVVIPIFIRTHLSSIDEQAKTIDDLLHQDYVAWYKKTIYSDFDIHDIIIGAMIFGEKVEFPNLLEFDVSNLLVEEIDEDSLKQFLRETYERLEFLKNITDEEAMEKFLAKKKELKVADLPTTSEFINKCIDYCFDFIDNN